MVSGLDATTMIIAATVAFAVPTVTFCILTATRYNDPAGRVWSVGPIALCAALTAVATEPGDLDRSLEAAVAGCVVFSVGCVWLGLRAHHQRGDLYTRVLVAATVVAIVVAAVWPGAADILVGTLVAAGGTAVVVELIDHRGPRTEPALIRVAGTAIALWGVAVVILVLAGSDTTGRLDDAETLVALSVGEAVVLIALATLRTQAAVESSTVRPRTGFLSHDEFIAEGTDRLQRAQLLGVRAQFFVLFADGLEVIEAAYGKAAVQVAVQHVADVVRAKVPASALIGRLDDGQVAVLTTSSRYAGPEPIIESVQTGLATAPAPERLPLRIDVGVRVATVDPSAALLRASVAPLST